MFISKPIFNLRSGNNLLKPFRGTCIFYCFAHVFSACRRFQLGFLTDLLKANWSFSPLYLFYRSLYRSFSTWWFPSAFHQTGFHCVIVLYISGAMFVWSCAWKLSNRILLNWHYIWTPYSAVAVVFKYKSIFWLLLIMAAAYFSLVAKCVFSLAVGDRVILKCFPKTNTTYAPIFSSFVVVVFVVVMTLFLISNVVYRLVKWVYRA